MKIEKFPHMLAKCLGGILLPDSLLPLAPETGGGVGQGCHRPGGAKVQSQIFTYRSPHHGVIFVLCEDFSPSTVALELGLDWLATPGLPPAQFSDTKCRVCMIKKWCRFERWMASYELCILPAHSLTPKMRICSHTIVGGVPG